MDSLFAAAATSGLRITAGQVLSDRVLPEPLLTTPDRARAEGRALIERWHGVGQPPLRRHPALLPVGVGADARRLRELLRRRAPGSPPTSTRTAPRSTRSRATSRPRALPRHLPAPLADHRPQRAGPQRPRHRHELEVMAPPGPGRRTARPATRRWVVACSRCVGTSTTASASPSAPTSGPAPVSACSRRAYRPTSSNNCWDPPATRWLPSTCSTWPPAPELKPSVWPIRWVISASASSSTPSGCVRNPQHPRRRPRPRRRRRRGPGQDLRPRDVGRRRRGVGRRSPAVPSHRRPHAFA